MLSPLTQQQRAQFEAVQHDGPERFQRRCQIVLLADDGQNVAAIAEALGLSASGVRYWIRRFKTDGMAILEGAEAAEKPAAAKPAKVAKQPKAASKPASEKRQKSSPASAKKSGKAPEQARGITLEALCGRYSVDLPHVQHVAGLAEQLFDATTDLHGMGADERRLLTASATLHSLGYKLDPDNYHLVGRDVIMKHTLVGFSKAEHRILACVVALSRKKAKPRKEPLFKALKKKQRRLVLMLTALLRVANGLDYSYTQTCEIVDVRLLDGVVAVVVEGDYADLNAARAEKAADLWQRQFEVPLQARERYPLEEVRKDMAHARLDSALSMAAAGRVLMEHYLMLAEQHADALRDNGADSLPLLERDVARLQGLFDVFGDYYDATVLGAFKKDVRWLYERVDDALLSRAAVSLARISEGGKVLVSIREAEAEAALTKVRRAVDGTRYQQFLTSLLRFCRSPEIGAFPGAHNHVPVGKQAALLVWTQFALIRVERAESLDIQDQYRLVRRFHKLLHYFTSLFGPELDSVLMDVQLFDAELRDIMLGEAVLNGFSRELRVLQKSDNLKKKQAAILQSLGTLADFQAEWLESVHAALAPLWKTVETPEFRRSLALAISAP